ncbi:D-aminoacyl-tRNA deacylase [Gracilibacillus alcaliphilus]|uniref:D-aminoacyl-tRNA deacylase n=1 Tax=Gracilibacillus alcaliphilus TaxID=1401441 RepID=UPI00195E65F2|nr:D-aminoacyl-tRNA deacylase [Gracilibacillus alcaliphilus]MBM7678592.1 D-tyrosyl-tRNA(Tyr) deacylase [Gracilibacillus alcaliphilus]
MRVVLQRAKQASVTVDNEVIGAIDNGYLALVGITHADSEKDIDYLVNKMIHLRIFEDEKGKMNLSLQDVGGAILSISQFTLYGDTRKGRRPNFMQSAKPEQAERLYNLFNQKLKEAGIHVETGRFGAMMDIRLTNHGPVTIMLDSDHQKDGTPS